jgi:hypothetical protein
LGIAHIFPSVTFSDFNTEPFEAIGCRRFLLIRPGNTEAQVDQHLGDPGHADTTDANKMDMLNSAKHETQLSDDRCLMSVVLTVI